MIFMQNDGVHLLIVFLSKFPNPFDNAIILFPFDLLLKIKNDLHTGGIIFENAVCVECW